MNNCIEISRKILDWEYYKDINTFRVLTYLLLNADEESVVKLRPDSIASNVNMETSEVLDALLKLNVCGMIDVYYDNINIKKWSKWAIVIRPSVFYEIGNDFFELGDEYIVNLPNCSGRNSKEYRSFRNSVLKRDRYTCRNCGAKKDLQVHHIKHYAKYPKLRTKMANGITLCEKCHKEEHKNER